MLSDFKVELAKSLTKYTGLSQEEMVRFLERPKDKDHGDLAFPCFVLAKKLKKKPNQIAEDLSQAISQKLPHGIQSLSVVGGFLNFKLHRSAFTQQMVAEITRAGDAVGNSNIGGGRVATFDYSAPNVAKPMSIGHLRSTVIGQAIVNIHKAVGFKTIGINYIGDWGVQFGKLAWAHLNKPELLKRASQHRSAIIEDGFNEKIFDSLISDVKEKPDDSFDYLYAIYVVFHACAQVDSELNDFGREYFVRLEQRSDADVEKIWKKFIDISLVEYQRVYKLLGIQFDEVRGESAQESLLPGVVESLKEKGLLKESQGAQIVDLSAFDMAPCLIQKSDGATLYATRDIASAEDRKNRLHAERLVYVVGAEQSLHFKQVFKVLELMGYSWAQDCIHVPFGLYRFKDGKMSTRRGNVIFLEDVLDRSIELVQKIIQEKNPDLANAEQVAIDVGTGAIVFNDLMNDRQKNIDFDWDRVLDFNGDTGPYVQYSNVRCESVLKKWGKTVPEFSKSMEDISNEEWNVVMTLSKFDEVVKVAFEQLKPNWIAQYLLELSKAFNGFYYAHRILEGETHVQESRVALVNTTKVVLQKGLKLLGVRAPKAM